MTAEASSSASPSPMGVIAAEVERRRKRLRLAITLLRSLIKTSMLLLIGCAIWRAVTGAWGEFVDAVQSIAILGIIELHVQLRLRLHEVETRGLRVELTAEVIPRSGPPFTWEKKRPPERAN